MDDLKWMEKAFLEAEKADPAETYENPRVGAVIVKDDVILAKGRHALFGCEHAEMAAYSSLADKDLLAGATLYVTLEPCASTGKAGSCADSIASWPIHRVVIGSTDPNPSTKGMGMAKLKEAGIIITNLHLESMNRNLNPAFFHFFERGLPYVQLKLTTSEDGFVSRKASAPVKLSNVACDQDVHHERACRSAILVGSQTFLADEPSLTVRHFETEHEQPKRVVLDRRGRLKNVGAQRLEGWLVYTHDKEWAKSCENVFCVSDGELCGILEDLSQKKIQSVMVEGGPTLIAAFLQADLWQEMLVYETDVSLGAGLKAISPNGSGIELGTVGNAVKYRYINQKEPS
ncbi:bifunctional diaminohydroxyphosphoribosylaminopyrimidine deaminase/5-amino-6-(5-phosphoribosylamino)uracil reductase RibD [Fructobacillus sp. M2-14]|uniref:Riboflavin biosynthesis protein RibD n=1 Tax=Fructobacillus broussonetiae TaxID=2713173 RepID=A0ABS5QY64_9LACO|nr:bifunctional diaminohydroxyphosphoribosylaminopyrimidine deaminase/5-amino-6-(5-phosphoribosylamino)uracil reductase RibD [Fructobacillus broussonetiae]MBS9338143.1 bifunctional diaminohydroxyphosphoribosylaminopyrimidine deaminase/5-amino-6-(5-phosphoribosylamino)uracil reductase RibD [Fructobacillus broussonetiae]